MGCDELAALALRRTRTTILAAADNCRLHLPYAVLLRRGPCVRNHDQETVSEEMSNTLIRILLIVGLIIIFLEGLFMWTIAGCR